MAKRRKIAETVKVPRRYVRSVDVCRDLGDSGALEGYVVTPGARDAIERLSRGLSHKSAQRAFRLVGPYGSGKSAFALWLANLAENVQGAQEPWERTGLEGAPPLIEPHRAIVLNGRHSSIVDVIHQALVDAGLVIERADWNKLAASDRSRLCLKALSKAAENTVVKEGRRLLLVLDEFGRFVEHASLRPQEQDPSFFQSLAELAGGSGGTPLGVVALLHNRFSDYVSGLGSGARAEWAKSAERYEEIAFGGGLEQNVGLLSRALRSEGRRDRAVDAEARETHGKAIDRGLYGDGRAVADIDGRDLFPLHPTVIVALDSVARRLGQNERSIFGFLQSSAPHGFQRFAIETNHGPEGWYRLPELFRYLSDVQPTEFSSPDRARIWERARDAVSTFEGSAAAEDVLRCIGIIAALEPLPGIKADADTLAWVTGADAEEVERAIDELVDANLVHRRPQSSDLGLWSRSSVDLAAWLEEAAVRVPRVRGLSMQSEMPPLRPLVAHAHYQRTGTLRAFEIVTIADGEEPKKSHAQDGVVHLLLRHPGAETIGSEPIDLAPVDDPMSFVAVQDVDPSLLDTMTQLKHWRYVRSNCVELRVDDYARAEVDRRLRELELEVADSLGALTTMTDTRWYHLGEEIEAGSRRRLNELLSAACDQAFPDAPILRNELINRERLSAAISTARTRLLERMIENEGDAMLGLDTGAPPERTIHLSMFEASGLHAEVDGVHRFGPPPEDDPLHWRPAWDRLAGLVSGDEAIGLDELLRLLAIRPTGLKSGPALLLIAAFMLHNRTRLSFMERGTFVPEMTPAHFMRAAKNPKNFQLQLISSGDERQAVMDAAALRLSIGAPSDTHSVHSVVEHIFRRFNALPECARRTLDVTRIAQDVRSALTKAHDPVELMVERLPAACGTPISDEEGRMRFAETLSQSLEQLEDVEPTLRRAAEKSLTDAFGEEGASALRQRLTADFGSFRNQLTDFQLRQFLDRTLKPIDDHDRWLDGIAGLLAGRRIENWDDDMLGKFDFNARDVAGRLDRWLYLMRRRRSEESSLTSVHVTSTGGQEEMDVVDVSVVDAAAIGKLRSQLDGVENPKAVLTKLLMEMLQVKEDEKERSR